MRRTGVIARRSSLRPSRGTVISPELRLAVYQRDQGCVGRKCFDGSCEGALECDHVRASHGMGMKSETTLSNLVALCNRHHEWKTSHGREARPILLSYLASFEEHTHVDPVPGCVQCFEAFG